MLVRALKCVLTATFLLAVAVSLSAQQRDFDQIFLSKGAPSRGSISEMGRDDVTLDMSGIGRPFPVNEIVRITFKDEPPELNAARTTCCKRTTTRPSPSSGSSMGTKPIGSSCGRTSIIIRPSVSAASR